MSYQYPGANYSGQCFPCYRRGDLTDLAEDHGRLFCPHCGAEGEAAQPFKRIWGGWMPDDVFYWGTVDPWHWNGWLCPRFPLEEARRIVKDQDALRARHGADAVPELVSEVPRVEGPPAFVMTYWEDTEPITTETIEADDHGLYSIGSHNWCWEPYRDEEEDTL